MIIRSLMMRHGRLALPKPPFPIRSWRRYLASEVEQTYTNPLEDQQYIAGGIGGSKGQAIQSLSTRNEVAQDDQVKADWEFFHHQKAVTGKIGSVVGPHYKPHELLSNPPRPQDITLELLMASQAHIGHSTSLWHPANAKYIFGVRGEHDPIHIISLDVTAAYLRRACKVVSGVAARGGLVLFVGSREGQARCVVNAAKMAQGCRLFTKWIPGTITNGQQILGKCKKKVVNHFDEEIPGFEDQLLQKAAVKPDLVVCLNTLENYVLLHECALNNIPTIGIIDTDCNPTWVTYPIPANDDSLRCVQVIAGVLGRAGEEGQLMRRKNASRGMLPERQDHGLEPPSEEDESARPQEKEQTSLQAAEAFDASAAFEEEVEDDVGFANVTVAEVDERMPVGVDESLTSAEQAGEHEELYASYDRDAPIEGGADSVGSERKEEVGFSPVIEQKSKVRDEGDWPAEAENKSDEWRQERP